MLIAQISDTHVCAEGTRLYGRIDTNAGLARAIDAVNRLRPRPDLVLMTGDLAESGQPAQYAMLRKLLARLEIPLRVLPGNHDSRENLRAAFADHGYLGQGEFLHHAAELGPLTLIALDTQVPGEDGGTLCAERLAWLERELERSRGRPTLVAMHHPPVPIGVDWLDRSNCANAEGLAGVVSRHPQVERVLCGHLHRPIQFRFAGTIAQTCPSPAHQVALDLAPDAKSQFEMEPPAFMLHAWRQGIGVVSHTAYIGDFAGPYPFFDVD